MKQTALKMFMQYLKENNYYISAEMVDKYWDLIAVEKEQICEAWKNGNLPTNLGRVITEEEYYNEKYNK